MFCGAGGSSIGVLAAGAELWYAINHWDKAIETYAANHPNVTTYLTDINKLPPNRLGSTEILIASPECQGHTIAAGISRQRRYQAELFSGKAPDPSAERSRATMFNVPEWAEQHRYKGIITENVVEVTDWILYPTWLQSMQILGYEYKELFLNSMFFHPTPQSRDRIYTVFWRKGNKAPDLEFTFDAYCPHCERACTAEQHWKRQPAIGKFRTQYYYRCTKCKTTVMPYYYPAASAINWELPCPTIGSRKKRPLVENTRARVRAGLSKYPFPFLADMVHTPRNGRHQDMVYPVSDPHRALLTQQTTSLIIQNAYDNDHHRPVTHPMPTMTTRQDCALLTSYYGASDTMHDANLEAHPTVSTRPHAALLKPHPFIMGYYTRDSGDKVAASSVYAPHPTLSTQKRHALVIPPEITDEQIDACGYRMITADEHQVIMAIPPDYKVEGPQDVRVKLFGNAVTPPVMTAIFSRLAATFN